MLEGVEGKLLGRSCKTGRKLLQRRDNRGLPMNYCLLSNLEGRKAHNELVDLANFHPRYRK